MKMTFSYNVTNIFVQHLQTGIQYNYFFHVHTVQVVQSRKLRTTTTFVPTQAKENSCKDVLWSLH